MTDKAPTAWHCRQIPNGPSPVVVCEREELQEEIVALRAVVNELIGEAMNPWPEDHPLGAAMRRALNDRSNPEGEA